MISDLDGEDGVVDIAIEMTNPTAATAVGPSQRQQQHQNVPQQQQQQQQGSTNSTANGSVVPNIGTSNDDSNISSNSSSNRRTQREMKIAASNETPALKTIVQEKTRTYLHRFFYPHQHPKEYLSTTASTTTKAASQQLQGEGQQQIHGRNKNANDENHPSISTETNTTGTVPGIRKRQHRPTNDPLSSSDLGHNDHHDDRYTIETKHTPNDDEQQQQFPDMNDPDVKFVTNFWTTYDDILILSIFTQLGIIFRLAIAIWFTWFDDVFSNDSALFVNLPLNCLSCFLMGLLCSGERLMEIIATRFSPPRTQQSIVAKQQQEQQQFYYDDNNVDHEDDDDLAFDQRSNGSNSISATANNNHRTDGIIRRDDLEIRQRRQRFPGGRNTGILRRRRRTKKEKANNEPRYVSWQPPVCLDEELRDVQLLALERRIRMSKCLVLFPVRKEDVDVMEHYFQEGYKRTNNNNDSNYDSDSVDSTLSPSGVGHVGFRENSDDIARSPSRRDDKLSHANTLNDAPSQQQSDTPETATSSTPASPDEVVVDSPTATANNVDYMADITDLATNIQDNVQENITRLRRVNLADGWDTGTTAKEMSDDLMLGLRDGFCGALSSFSSWNSAMVSLMRKGQITQALVGYMIGLQLPIVAYRFGQHVAVYIFIWRTRQETHKDERRGGYGIRLANIDDDDIEQADSNNHGENSDDDDDEEKRRKAAEDDMPSLRAVITAVFLLAIVTQCTSIYFYSTPENQQIALSLLFSPLGVFARWRLGKLNRWKPTFPIGTFTCNILACALSGSIGTYNQVVLVSIVNGFGGTLSSLASFVVEILAGIDPVLFRYDGAIYAAASIGCAMVVGFIFEASVEWADAVVTRTATATTDIPVLTDDDVATIANITSNLTRNFY